jgi:hypothetical protein
MTDKQQFIKEKILAPRKSIWLREELGDLPQDLDQARDQLLAEFLVQHPGFLDGDRSGLSAYRNPILDVEKIAQGETWLTDNLAYSFPRAGIKVNLNDEHRRRYPTACALTDKWSDHITCYSVITPNSVIERHTGPENWDANYVRVHLPLVIPEGDIFFEVEGVEITWADIFGFDNSLPHSAYNNSDRLRLIFMIDVRRELLGVEPGKPYERAREMFQEPFVRGTKPRLFHTCEQIKDV